MTERVSSVRCLFRENCISCEQFRADEAEVHSRVAAPKAQACKRGRILCVKDAGVSAPFDDRWFISKSWVLSCYVGAGLF